MIASIAGVCETCATPFLWRPGRSVGRFCSPACVRRERIDAEGLAARASPEPNTGCWLWCGSADTAGYGRIDTVRGSKSRYVGVHRLSWEASYGPIPEGLHVLHRCDQPACMNPAHLFLGTPSDNMRDMVAKGRMPRGEKAARSKITAAKAREIRAALDLGKRPAAVARECGVSPSTVGGIAAGRTWGHLWPKQTTKETR